MPAVQQGLVHEPARRDQLAAAVPQLVTIAGERASLRFLDSSRPTSATRQKLAPVGPRSCHLLAVDVPAAAPGGAQLQH
jgi:hypothetical protein